MYPMKTTRYEIPVRILATGKVQIISTDSVMSHIHYSQREGLKAHGAPTKLVGSATYTETHATVDGSEMSRARHGQKYGPQIGHTIWVVSKLQHADGSFIAFAATALDERNL